MNRGKTALKRGVAVASVAAMAIAGAVLAAPAASAAGPTTTGIRATPIADAAFISDGAVITKASDYNASNVYDLTASGVGTGDVPVVGVGASQAVSGFQVEIPLASGAAAWTAGTGFTLTLGGGATFAGAPSVDITRQPVVFGDLAKQAGWAGSQLFGSPMATVAANAVAGAGADNTVAAPVLLPANASQRITAAVDTSDATKLNVTLPTADPNTGNAAATAGYLVTVSGVKVAVKDTAAPAAITVGANGYATTIGYISPFTVSTPANTGYVVQKSGNVSLPDITVAESSKAGFAAGAGSAVSLSASGDAAAVVPAPTVKFAVAGTTNLGSLVTTTGSAVDTLAAGDVDNTKLQSMTLSGLVVSGLKAGSDLTVTMDGPTSGATNTNPAGKFSNTPGQASVTSLTIKQNSSAPRIAGSNRYATAADIAAQYGTANAIVLANGTNPKNGFDALSANFLAGAVGGPILLTDSSDSLPAETQAAIVQVFKSAPGVSGAVTIYVMGKTDSVSAAAAAQAKFVASAAVASGTTVNVVRLDGANRYATSADAVADAVTAKGAGAVGSYNLGKGSLKTAFLASGAVNADALAAGALSAGAGIPVLLTDGSALDPAVQKVVTDNGIGQFIVLGSTDRVSAALVDSLTKAGANVVRVAGTGTDGRYDTASALATLATASTADGGLSLSLGSTAYLANGTAGFPDALSVGPLAGINADALLTVPATTLPDSTAKFLKDNKGSLSEIEALGQTDRVADSVVTAAQTAIGF